MVYCDSTNISTSPFIDVDDWLSPYIQTWLPLSVLLKVWSPPSQLAPLGVFDMPNSYWYNILSISIFCKIPLSISIFFICRYISAYWYVLSICRAPLRPPPNQLVPNSQLDPPSQLVPSHSTKYFPLTSFHKIFPNNFLPKCFHQKLPTKKIC